MAETTEVKEEVTTVEKAVPQHVVHKTTTVTPPPIQTEHPQKVFEKKKTIFRANQIVWYILIVIEVLLGFRLTLLALGANPYSGFTNLIYAITNPLALPFRGILGTPVAGSAVFEWSTLIAALVYALIAFAIVHLMQLVKPVSPHEVEREVDNP